MSTRMLLTFRSISLLLLLEFGASLNLVQAAGFDLNLALESAQPESLQQTSSNTPALERILADNYDGEFAMTEQTLGSVTKLLESFAHEQGLNQADLMKGQEISRWLASRGTSASQNPLLAHQASELDLVFGTFWTPFMHLVQRIITFRPDQLSMKDLAFRCEQRASEIQALNELASKSSLYRVMLDVFNTDLYTHCLRRKLATLRLHHVEPPTELRQLVDVYIELPLDTAGSGSTNFKLTNQARANHVNRVYADCGQNFNLERAIERYGPIENAAQLVLTSQMSFGGVDINYAQNLAARFKEQCARYTTELLHYWANFDQIAATLSSDTNNLADLNERLKYVEPHLIYASVCNQLLHKLT